MITSTWTCDYCGEEIYGPCFAAVQVRGRGIDLESGEAIVFGERDERHYHAGSAGSCYRLVMEALWLAEDAGPSLESIPTISAQAVAARRRKHTKQGEED